MEKLIDTRCPLCCNVVRIHATRGYLLIHHVWISGVMERCGFAGGRPFDSVIEWARDKLK